jgi:hypothetical protein
MPASSTAACNFCNPPLGRHQERISPDHRLRQLPSHANLVFGVPFFAIAVRWRWKINLPVPAVPMEGLSPLASNFICMLVALLFVLAAQLIVERTEI